MRYGSGVDEPILIYSNVAIAVISREPDGGVFACWYVPIGMSDLYVVFPGTPSTGGYSGGTEAGLSDG